MTILTMRGAKPLKSACVLCLTVGFLPSLVKAELQYQTAVAPGDMATVLEGPGLQIRNLAVTRGSAQQYGIFTNGKPLLGVEKGIFMNTGNLGSLQGPNSSVAYSYNTKTVYLDPDIARISNAAKYDPVTVDFDVIPQGDRLNFIYSFGSEEYPEYVCSQFNDAFGLFVSGPGLDGVRNAAFLPGSTTAVAVNNVNAGFPGAYADGSGCQLHNAQYFVDNGNGSGSPVLQLDGYTRVATAAIGSLAAGQAYHVKLALADAGDSGYDSGAFFKWLTSTRSSPVDLSLSNKVDTATPFYNSTVTLEYTVHNASDEDTEQVRVGLDWPAGVSWVSDDANGAYNPATGEWNAGSIPAKSARTLKVQANVGDQGSYTLSGEILYAFNEDPDSTPMNRQINPTEDDTASVTLTPMPVPPFTLGTDLLLLSVAENSVVVTTLKADGGKGETVTYSIQGGKDAARFRLDTTSGALGFLEAPDYEVPQDADLNNVYEVLVKAGSGSFTATQTVLVTVTDVEDSNQFPNLVYPASLSYPENAITPVLDLEASDDHDSEGQGLVYGLTNTADSALFQLHETQGTLRFKSPPNYEQPADHNRDNAYLVGLQVCDSKSACTEQVIVVNVADVDEDSDNDGLADSVENQLGTDVAKPDSDGDGVYDLFEVGIHTQPFDHDNDGKIDAVDTDDDGDGLLTRDEKPDSDGNGNPADAYDEDGNGIPAYIDTGENGSVALQLRVFLQGAYQASTGWMRNDLYTLKLLPATQPYGSLAASFGYADSSSNLLPFSHFGKETAAASVLTAQAGNAPVDWVLVELRNADDPSSKVGAVAALVQRDGDVVDAATGSTIVRVPNMRKDAYYVMVRHRNHLAVMSAVPWELSAKSVSMDFASADTPVYGGEQARLSNGKVALLWAGDTNHSNTVIANGPGSDASVILGTVLASPDNEGANVALKLYGYYATDLNLDGSTVYSGPGNDLNLLLGNVLLFPDNTLLSANYVIQGRAPR